MPILNYLLPTTSLFFLNLPKIVGLNSIQKTPSITEKISFLIFKFFEKRSYFFYPLFTLKDCLIKKRALLREDPLSQLPLDVLKIVREQLPLVDRKNLSQIGSTFYCDLQPLYLSDLISSRMISLRHMKYLLSKEGGNIRSLNLSFHLLSSNDLKLISSYCPHLKSLYLIKKNQISGEALIEVAKQCPGLQFLNLGWCEQISDETLIEVTKLLPCLQSLFLNGCEQISGEALIKVAEQCPRLQFLNLAWCPQISETIIEVAKLLPCLQFLNLEGCKISSKTRIKLTNFCPRLKFLNSGRYE